MAQEQRPSPNIIVNVPGDLVGRPDAGMIRVAIPPGTTPQQMSTIALQLAKQQADTASPGLVAPGGQSRVGLNLAVPGSDAAADVGPDIRSAVEAMPQVAAFLAQLFPAARAGTGMLRSLAASAGGQVGSNFLADRSPGEGVIDEMAWGGALGAPQAVGKLAKEAAPDIMRHNLFRTTPVEAIDNRMEEVLPRVALDLRATPTSQGVAAMRSKAVRARDTADDAAAAAQPYMGFPANTAVLAAEEAALHADDVQTIANMLEGVRKQASVRGSGGGMSAVLPGAGAMTTAARATGMPPRVAQIASPAVAAAKGNPRRRMAWARQLDRPGNLASSDDIGFWTSQVGRALRALYEGMQPVASHERVSEESIRRPSALPARRRQQ